MCIRDSNDTVTISTTVCASWDRNIDGKEIQGSELRRKSMYVGQYAVK